MPNHSNVMFHSLCKGFVTLTLFSLLKCTYMLIKYSIVAHNNLFSMAPYFLGVYG